MKKFIVIVLIAIIGCVIYGQVGKSMFKSNGFEKIETVDDAYEQKCDIDFAFGENAVQIDGFLFPQNEVEQGSEYILVVKPYNDYHQFGNMHMQKVKVTKVIKGNESILNTDISISVSYGFVITDGVESFNSLSNVLDYNYEYLVFLNPSKLNPYTKEQVYYVFNDIPLMCFRITDNESDFLYEDGMSFDQMKETEYFCYSKETLEKIYEYKHRMIKKYVK